MNITKLPFVEKVGIKRNDNNLLELLFDETVQNHVQTIHAGAQYTLAETASGEILQTEFPDLVGKVVPILRESQVKYKKPAMKTITAIASISPESKQKFNEQLGKKGRASISVNVNVKDSQDTVTCIGMFNWFVQKIS